MTDPPASVATRRPSRPSDWSAHRREGRNNASSGDEHVIERVAALDIGKAEVVCCVRLPAAEGGTRRVQEVSTHSAMVLFASANWLMRSRAVALTG